MKHSFQPVRCVNCHFQTIWCIWQQGCCFSSLNPQNWTSLTSNHLTAHITWNIFCTILKIDSMNGSSQHISYLHKTNKDNQFTVIKFMDWSSKMLPADKHKIASCWWYFCLWIQRKHFHTNTDFEGFTKPANTGRPICPIIINHYTAPIWWMEWTISAAGEVNKELHEKITAFTKEYRLVDILMDADKAVNDTSDFFKFSGSFKHTLKLNIGAPATV